MRYYLKRCGYQELGSIKDGKAQRGRYLLTSMQTLDFFPPLSTTQLNDKTILPIIPLFTGKKLYCSFVYHNDKYHGSTAKNKRNEYRLYLNRQLDNNEHPFETDDIVIIRNGEISENNETQQVFFLDLIKDTGSILYNQLNTIINSSPIKGGYGVIEDDTLQEFERKVDALSNNLEISDTIDDSVTNQLITSDLRTIDNIFNSSSMFRDFVMASYNYRCAITGMVIRYETLFNLEAAHIKPRSHNGSFMPNNGIALCRDMHWAFDKGFFTLTNDYIIKVHPQITSDWLFSYNGKNIQLPKEQFYRPLPENIKYHNDNVFGLFLKTGRL